jgi:hypothetical protein
LNLSFQASNNYQKINLKRIFYFLFFRVCADAGTAGEGGRGGGKGGRGEGREVRSRGRPCPRGGKNASMRTRVFYSR